MNTEANITTIRIFDPESDNLKAAVRNWEVGEFNDGRGFVSSADTVRVSLHVFNYLHKRYLSLNPLLSTYTDFYICIQYLDLATSGMLCKN